MGGDEDVEAGQQLGSDGVLPDTGTPSDDVGEALARRQHFGSQPAIAPVVGRMLGAGGFDGRRRDIEASPPEVRLLGTMALGSLLLVESLQGAVVPLVEPPVALHWEPFEAHLAQGDVLRGHGAARALEVWDVSKRSPTAFIAFPAAAASASPSAVNGTSCQPVNRFSRFHELWPWRSVTSVPGMS